LIHLIGVDHFKAQRKKRGLDLTDIQWNYQSVVESAIASIRPDLLAEEDHPSYLSEDGAESILQPIARSHGIRHLFVEADRAMRMELGYKDFDMIYCLLIPKGIPSGTVASAHKIAHQFPIRERFWLRELNRTTANNVLLICGNLHLQTFTTMLTADGIPYNIFAERIGVDHSADPEYEAFRYAQNHNMFGETNCFCLES